MEKFKKIEGFEYQISNAGRVKSLRSGKFLKPQKEGPRRNYLKISLRKEGKTFQKKIQQLVAKAYIPNPLKKPTVNHEDGDTFNNWDWNLSWATYKEQEEHAKKLGLKTYDHNKGKDHPRAIAIIRIDKNGLEKEYGSVMDAARDLGKTNSDSITMIRVARGSTRHRSAYGYKWKFKD